MMTLVLKPKGPGNWAELHLEITGSRAQPILFRVGETIPLAGILFRICKVIA